MSTATLTADTILTIAARADFRAEFPFLRFYSQKTATGCCGGGRPGPDLDHAIRQIFGLPPDRKGVFKSLLGVDKVSARIVRAGRQRMLEF